MTNNEILNASFLDILFDNRNKAYGAYALRKGYNTRLLTAIGAAMTVILFFVLASVFKKERQSVIAMNNNNKQEVVIRAIEMPKEPEKPKEPEQPKKEVAKPKPAVPKPQVAQVKYTEPKIKPDELVKTPPPSTSDLDEKKIGTQTIAGIPDDKIVKPKEPAETPGSGGTGTEPVEKQPDFTAVERGPQFPGGPEALRRFLANNLRTPEELENGEKRVVHVRFKVDKDGTVNTFEIVLSAGDEFDDEVVRVAKRMPRWTPALQNGQNVPVTYVLPVTFIGVE